VGSAQSLFNLSIIVYSYQYSRSTGVQLNPSRYSVRVDCSMLTPQYGCSMSLGYR
jgi:hypothetical protein